MEGTEKISARLQGLADTAQDFQAPFLRRKAGIYGIGQPGEVKGIYWRFEFEDFLHLARYLHPVPACIILGLLHHLRDRIHPGHLKTQFGQGDGIPPAAHI
jgi:hypothetical protein